MLSIVVPIRNSRASAARCLDSLAKASAALGILARTEFIVVDDNSEAAQGIGDLMRHFKSQVPLCTLLRFKERRQYTAACALAFSLARGEQALLVSHDMIVTPDYLRTLLAAAAMDSSFGIVRGTSGYVDCFPDHCVSPPTPVRGLNDILQFSSYMASSQGLSVVEDNFLTGDSMLVTRAVLNKIGVMDRRFYGYFGDVDWGLRAQRAGFKIVCAKGAWLFHEGAAHHREEAKEQSADYSVIHEKRLEEVRAAFGEFCDKWGAAELEKCTSVFEIDFDRLRRLEQGNIPQFERPMTLDDPAIEVVG